MIRIRAARLRDSKAFRACFDAIARERIHLGSVVAPPFRRVQGYMRVTLGAKCPFYIALDRKRIVGWCDAGPREMEGFRHTVGLGTGLHEGRRVRARKLDGKYDDVILMGKLL